MRHGIMILLPSSSEYGGNIKESVELQYLIFEKSNKDENEKKS